VHQTIVTDKGPKRQWERRVFDTFAMQLIRILTLLPSRWLQVQNPFLPRSK
jgi:hypothetical protein